MELSTLETYVSKISPHWNYILRSSCVFLVLFFLLKKCLSYRKQMMPVKSLPTYKLRFYDILGHLSLLLNYRMPKYPFPREVYQTYILDGYLRVFGKEGIAQAWQMFYPYIFIFKADAVEAILNNSVELKKSQAYLFLHSWIGDGLLISDGSKWKERRKILTPAFHFHILKDFIPVLNTKSRILIDVLRNHLSSESFNIVTVVTRCSFDIICESVLGAKMNSQTDADCEYMKSVTTLTESIMKRFVSPWLWHDLLFWLSPTGRNFKHHKKLSTDLANKLIAQMKESKMEQKRRGKVAEKEEDEVGTRKKRPLLDLLLDEHLDNNSISLHDIREEVDTFMFEGHDTTSMAMSWTLYLIGLHPDVQSKLHAEIDAVFGDEDRDLTMDDLRDMKYLECVIKESLRIYPPVPLFGRHLQEDIEFGGKKYPKGTECMVMSYTLHRDPVVFPNPEKFDPERFSPENSVGRHPFAYVPFSAGPRNCIGQKFAMMEEKCVIAYILRHYSVKALDPRDRVNPVIDVVLRPYSGIRMQIRRREDMD